MLHKNSCSLRNRIKAAFSRATENISLLLEKSFRTAVSRVKQPSGFFQSTWANYISENSLLRSVTLQTSKDI